MESGGFQEAIQVSKVGMIREYRSQVQICGVIARQDNEEYGLFVIPEERIMKETVISMGTRDGTGIGLTGLIRFRNGSKHMFCDYYNHRGWYPESYIKVLSDSRNRQAPERDLTVSQEVDKLKKEREFLMTEKTIRRMKRIFEANELGDKKGWDHAYDVCQFDAKVGTDDDGNESEGDEDGSEGEDDGSEGEDDGSEGEDDGSEGEDDVISISKDDQNTMDDLIEQHMNYRESDENIQQIKSLVIEGNDYAAYVIGENREKRMTRIAQYAAALKVAKDDFMAAKAKISQAERKLQEKRVRFNNGQIDEPEFDSAIVAVMEARRDKNDLGHEVYYCWKKFKEALTTKESDFETMERKTRASIESEHNLDGKSQARNFILSMLYNKLRGEIPGKAQELQRIGYDDLAQNFFQWNNPHIGNMRGPSQVRKRRMGTSGKHYWCKVCNKNYATKKYGLCDACALIGEEPTKTFCTQCKAREVPWTDRRCSVCAKTNTNCVQCGLRKRRFKGGFCRACVPDKTVLMCVQCGKRKKRCPGGLCKACAK